MLLAQITDGQILDVKPAEAWGIFPIPCERRHWEPLGFLEAVEYLPHDPVTQKLSQAPWYVKDGKVFTVIVSEKDENDIENDKATALVQIKMQRNAKLSASDFTQLPDSPFDKPAWATYRQALRDLPKSGLIDDPRTFTNWPVAP